MDIHQGPDISHSPRNPGFIDRIFGRFRKDGAYPYWLKAVLPILSDGSVYDETLKRYFILCYVTGFACLVLNALAKWITGNPEIGFEGPLFFAMVYAYGFFYMWIMRKDLFEAQKFRQEHIIPRITSLPHNDLWWYVLKEIGLKFSLMIISLFVLQMNGATISEGTLLNIFYFVFMSMFFAVFNTAIVFFYFSNQTFDPPVFKFMVFVHLIGAVYLVYKINFVWGQ